LVAFKAKKSARIFSFEPLPPIYQQLQRNVKINKVEANLFNIALGDQSGESMIYFVKTISDTFDQASLNPLHFKRPSVGVPIVIKTMEEVILQHGIEKIDLMKIDVETYEPQVLYGMKHYLREYKPTILVEVLNSRVAEEIWSLIQGLGYNVTRIDEHVGAVSDPIIPFSKAGNYLLLNTTTHSIDLI
jgi:FkbM family methyltransferase